MQRDIALVHAPIRQLRQPQIGALNTTMVRQSVAAGRIAMNISPGRIRSPPLHTP